MMIRLKQCVVFIFLACVLFATGLQVGHHHDDAIVHNDCTVCHGVQLFSTVFVSGITFHLFFALVVLWVFTGLYSQKERFSSSFALARAPPFFSFYF